MGLEVGTFCDVPSKLIGVESATDVHGDRRVLCLPFAVPVIHNIYIYIYIYIHTQACAF